MKALFFSLTLMMVLGFYSTVVLATPAVPTSNVETAIQFLKNACVTLGSSLEIQGAGEGALLLNNLGSNGITGSTRLSKKEFQGFADAASTLNAQQASEMRQCMQPYIDRILCELLQSCNSGGYNSSTQDWYFSNSHGELISEIIVDQRFSNPQHYKVRVNNDCNSYFALKIDEKTPAKQGIFKFAIKKDGASPVNLVSALPEKLTEATEINGGKFYLARPGVFDFKLENDAKIRRHDAFRVVIQDGSSFDGSFAIKAYCG